MNWYLRACSPLLCSQEEGFPSWETVMAGGPAGLSDLEDEDRRQRTMR